jgi:hypothetical protein
MRSRSNGGVIGAYALPNQNRANGVFFIHDAAIFNTGANPIWPLASGFIYSATGGTITTAADNINYKVHTFTSNSTFTVSDGAGELEILMVGGGGSGGSVTSSASYQYLAGGGGGGGAVILIKTWVNPGTVFTVTVGPGGTNPNSSPSGRYFGGSSYVTSTAGHSYQASGGGPGGLVNQSTEVVPSTGGSGGGGWAGLAAGGGSGASAQLGQEYGTVYANAGGSGNSMSGSAAYGGGGGGAGGAGYDGYYSSNNTLSSNGGAGWNWSRTNAYYGSGGGGGRTWLGGDAGQGGISGPASASQNYGNGAYVTSQSSGSSGGDVSAGWYYGVGGGGSVANAINGTYYGGNGGPGTVIFCYRYK